VIFPFAPQEIVLSLMVINSGKVIKQQNIVSSVCFYYSCG